MNSTRARSGTYGAQPAQWRRLPLEPSRYELPTEHRTSASSAATVPRPARRSSDEVSNAGRLSLDLMTNTRAESEDLPRRMPFESAYGDFLGAAHMGLSAQFDWLDRQSLTAPGAAAGSLLRMREVRPEEGGDRCRGDRQYLTVIEQRVASGRTGSDGCSTGSTSRRTVSRNEAIVTATRGVSNGSGFGRPVHNGGRATVRSGRLEEAAGRESNK